MRKLRKHLTRLTALGTLALATAAHGAAQTNIVALTTDVKDTFDYVTPIGMTVAGLLIIWPIGKRLVRIFFR